MKHARFVYNVSVRKDPIPGWNNHPEDFKSYLERVLKEALEHYKPEVEYVGVLMEEE